MFVVHTDKWAVSGQILKTVVSVYIWGAVEMVANCRVSPSMAIPYLRSVCALIPTMSPPTSLKFSLEKRTVDPEKGVNRSEVPLSSPSLF